MLNCIYFSLHSIAKIYFFYFYKIKFATIQIILILKTNNSLMSYYPLQSIPDYFGIDDLLHEEQTNPTISRDWVQKFYYASNR